MTSKKRGDGFAQRLQKWRAAGDSAIAILMGVVNVTPDSFSDGGQFASSAAALTHAKRLITEGAEIIDIGGESTRPGSERVAEPEEELRVLPVVSELASKTSGGSDVLISIDTVKAAIANRALEAGAHVVNDIKGLQGDPEMAEVVAAHAAGIVMMHNPGLSGSATGTPLDAVTACLDYFEVSLAIAEQAGIDSDRIVIDPGLGFGKTAQQNLALVARLPELMKLGFPIMVGASRKSFIGTLLGRPAAERLAGTLTLHVAAAISGAAILRVHDVAEHFDAVRLVGGLKGALKQMDEK